ncbi:hypothetical protein [Nocardioides sp. AN3]
MARQLGYSGALVPGVELFEHLARVPLAHFGPDWFERGELSARFRRPVYEGAPVVVTALERGDRLELSAEVDGVQCVEGVASLPAQDSSPPAGLQPVPPPPPGLLPPADEESLAPGVRLSIGPRQISRADSAAYLAAVDEGDSLYAEHGIVPPGLLLRLCHRLVDENVVLGPWIHTWSRLRSLAPARVDSRFTALATVKRNEVRKGHHYVELDAFLVANGEPVAAVAHEAIYRLRSAERSDGQ